MENLNIVELIEKNPIAKLSVDYNNRLLNKIKENFSGFEQQLFISSFYCYLNYDKNVDYVIDLDDIWKWLGFSQKIRAKEILEKHFKLDIDYKTGLFCQKVVSDIIKNNKDIEENKHTIQNGGQNKI
jgi:hypothetical protein